MAATIVIAKNQTVGVIPLKQLSIMCRMAWTSWAKPSGIHEGQRRET